MLLTWNSSLTLWFVLADVSIKCEDHFLACSSPSLAVSSRASVSSHLFPTSMSGTLSNEPCVTYGTIISVVNNKCIHVYSLKEGGLYYFDFSNDFPRGSELLERLSGSDRVDHNEGVALGDVEPLHGRELMTPRRVRDLQRAHVVLVARYHLVRIKQCVSARHSYGVTQHASTTSSSLGPIVREFVQS